MFDCGWDGRPLNQVSPTRIPNHSPGSYMVIARLVWPDRVEHWPARAVRWTDVAVLVGVQIVANDWRTTRYLWLPPADVARVLRRDVAGPEDQIERRRIQATGQERRTATRDAPDSDNGLSG